MPRTQEGSIIEQGKGYAVRFRDAQSRSRRQGGFKTERQARRWLDNRLDEIAAERRGEAVHRRVEVVTVNELIDRYLEHHPCAPETKRTLTERSRYLRRQFGDVLVSHVTMQDLIRWRETLPEKSAHGIFRVARQLFNHATAIGMIPQSPAAGVKNPEPDRPEVETISGEEAAALDLEMPKYLRGIVTFARECGLRPEELCGLERGDIDRQRMTVSIRRVYVRGQLHERGKTKGSKRDVPLTPRALEALDSREVVRLSRIVWPGERGGRLAWDWFLRACWRPALIAAGISPRPFYSTRHSYISRLLAGGLDLLSTAKYAGTSPRMIERTYFHLSEDAADRARAALEATG